MDLKGYSFNTKEAFLYYIENLIISIFKHLENYERQIKELGDYIEER